MQEESNIKSLGDRIDAIASKIAEAVVVIDEIVGSKPLSDAKDSEAPKATLGQRQDQLAMLDEQAQYLLGQVITARSLL